MNEYEESKRAWDRFDEMFRSISETWAQIQANADSIKCGDTALPELERIFNLPSPH